MVVKNIKTLEVRIHHWMHHWTLQHVELTLDPPVDPPLELPPIPVVTSSAEPTVHSMVLCDVLFNTWLQPLRIQMRIRNPRFKGVWRADPGTGPESVPQWRTSIRGFPEARVNNDKVASVLV